MTLTVALSKGKLLAGATDLFRRAGVPFPDEPGRRLVVDHEGLRFLFVKDADVPTYVEYGVADCGIAGRDVLLEAGSDVYEPLDLGFGRCRLVVARPRGARGRPALVGPARRDQVPAGGRHLLPRARRVGGGGAPRGVGGAGPRPRPLRLHRRRGGDGRDAGGQRPGGGGGRRGVERALHREPRELSRPPRGRGGAHGRACARRCDEDPPPRHGRRPALDGVAAARGASASGADAGGGAHRRRGAPRRRSRRAALHRALRRRAPRRGAACACRRAEIRALAAAADPALVEALRGMARRIEAYHRRQPRAGFRMRLPDGSRSRRW